MYAQVKYADLSHFDRVIAVSDMHAHPEVFSAVLEKVGFCDSDALVIVGDLVNRGEQSLEMLRQVMALARQENVYVLLGNNDAHLLEWVDGKLENGAILRDLQAGNPSIRLEMAKKVALPYETEADAEQIRLAVQAHFQEEIAFLRGLPHILDSDVATFVHAGLQPGDLHRQDPLFCLTVQGFDDQPRCYDKPVIVGHWPASNYNKDIFNANVRVNPHSNVVSIDGGLGVKFFGQMNYYIIHPKTGKKEWGYFDNHHKILVLDDQEANEEYLTVNFPDTKLVIESQTETEVHAFLPALDLRMTFPCTKSITTRAKSTAPTSLLTAFP